MIDFDEKYFKELNFSQKRIEKFFNGASKDLNIAGKFDLDHVRFVFSYGALIKLGIVLIACHNRRVSSRTGHHQKIIETMSNILNDKDVFIYGDRMRKIRNKELYEGGMMVTEKQAEEYYLFVKNVHKSTENFIKKHFNSLF